MPTDILRWVQFRDLHIRNRTDERVCMGHTQYSELANDGCTSYEASRSTGQIEKVRWADVFGRFQRVSLRAAYEDGQAHDEIFVLVNQDCQYNPPKRSAVDCESEIAAYPAKCLFGTQPGPNENGTKGPWPAWR